MAKKSTKGEQPADPEAPPPEPFDPEAYRVQKATDIWSYDDTGFDLTIEERLFVRSYMIDRNPIAALRRLNYNYEMGRLKTIAAKMLNNPEVKGAVEFLAKRMMDALEITAERVQRRIAAVAFFDPRQVVQFDQLGVEILNSRFWTEEQAYAISSVKMGQHGLEIKLHDGLRAAEMLAKQLALQPEDGAANSKEVAEAAADAVINKIVDAFVRTKELDPDEVDREYLLLQKEKEERPN